MSDIAMKLSIDKIIMLFGELHATGQSKMNQEWSFHDQMHFKDKGPNHLFLDDRFPSRHKQSISSFSRCLHHGIFPFKELLC